MIPIDLDMTDAEFHAVCRRAVDAMREMARSHETFIGELGESQLVYEIGYQFRSGELWTGIEIPYPREAAGRTNPRSDLLVFGSDTESTRPTHMWVEAKSTGMGSSRENNYGSLRWQDDFEKLSALDNRIWGGRHSGYWVWLHLVETYRSELIEGFGESSEWSGATSLPEFLNITDIGSTPGQRVTLGNLLVDIDEKALDSSISCVPGFGDDPDDRGYATLLVTAKIK